LLAGMKTLWESGLQHVAAGRTTIEELQRVVEPPSPSGFRRPRTPPRPIPAVMTTAAPVAAPLRPVAPLSPRSVSARGGSAFQLSEDLLELVDEMLPGAARRPVRSTVLLVEDEMPLRRVVR